MNKYYLSLLCFVMLGVVFKGYAQPEMKYELAKDLYQRLAYSEAIPLLEDYLKKKDRLEAQIMLADAYRQNNQYAQAALWYAKLVSDTNLKDSSQYLCYAQILQTLQKYEESSKNYEDYLAKNPNDRRAQNQYYATTHIAAFSTEGKDRYIVENMPFNTDGYDFGAALLNGKFIYTSTGGKSLRGKTNMWTGQPFMGLYDINIDADCNLLGSPKRWSKAIDTKYNEGPLCFSPTENKIYFTRNNYNPDEKGGKMLTYSDGGEANLKIYEGSRIDDSTITQIKQLPFNNKNYSCGHPTISNNAKTLYFASNMPGGFGGTDIWKVEKTVDGSWGAPENLGNVINTEGDEMFPFLMKDSLLYFASDGLPGWGGLDIFVYNLETKTSPKNVGVPFNTSYDDFSFMENESGSWGFFSSNRPEGHGDDDIYMFKKYFLEVLVLEKGTNLPVKERTINVSQGGKMMVANQGGRLEESVVSNKRYEISVDAPDYIIDTANIVVLKDSLQRVQQVVFYAKKLEMSVLVVDADTKKPIERALVAVEGGAYSSPQNLTTQDNGLTVSISIKKNSDYRISANAEGYLSNGTNVHIDSESHTVYIALHKISDINNIVVLNNIYYNFDKWDIRPDAVSDLNVLKNFLLANPTARVQIGSHTDARGADKYNMQLSQKRAESVVMWLYKNGVGRETVLIPKGYGETEPVNKCVNNIKCTEEEHQRNRRTDFRIINVNEVLYSRPKKDFTVDSCKKCPF